MKVNGGHAELIGWAHRFSANLRRRDQGASLVEYALLVALIAVVCIAAVAFFGSGTSDTFSRVANSVDAT